LIYRTNIAVFFTEEDYFIKRDIRGFGTACGFDDAVAPFGTEAVLAAE
jgi:hypothetical protein